MLIVQTHITVPFKVLQKYFKFIMCLRSFVSGAIFPIKKIFWGLKWDWDTRLGSQSQNIDSFFTERYTNPICSSSVNSHIYISGSMLTSGNQLIIKISARISMLWKHNLYSGSSTLSFTLFPSPLQLLANYERSNKQIISARPYNGLFDITCSCFPSLLYTYIYIGKKLLFGKTNKP